MESNWFFFHEILDLYRFNTICINVTSNEELVYIKFIEILNSRYNKLTTDPLSFSPKP